MRRLAPPSGLAALLLLAPISLLAQIPDSFENLKVLDQDIERPELVAVMQGWTKALGVRCTHCHVGPDDLQGMDFATDEKAAKRTARRMLTMAYELNGELLAGLPVVEEQGRASAQRVTCAHCHRGLPTPPQPTEIELEQAVASGGPAAAIERFRELGEKHADAGRYDLRSTPLFQLGRTLINGGQLAEAKELLAATVELFPDFADAHVLLGQAEAMSGDLDAARAAIAKAREIDPENRFSVWLEGQIAAREGGPP